MAKVTEVAQAFADETRLSILRVLLEGEATVNDMADRLSLSQPRISTHLAALREAGLVSSVSSGRQHTYSLHPKKVGKALAALQALADADEQPIAHHKHKAKGKKGAMSAILSPQAAREVQHNSDIRQARTCYDHLAGVAGVQLLDEMLKRNWLTKQGDAGHPTYQLTAAGSHALSERGVDLSVAAQARRAFAYGCLDWTERRSHLGGALGAAILQRMVDAGDVQPQEDTRAVNVVKPVGNWFDAPSGSLYRIRFGDGANWHQGEPLFAPYRKYTFSSAYYVRYETSARQAPPAHPHLCPVSIPETAPARPSRSGGASWRVGG